MTSGPPSTPPLGPQNPSRRNRIARVTLGALSLVSAVLACAEIHLRRTIHPPPSTFPFPQPALHRSFVEVSRPVLGLTPRRVEVRTNALGLRGDDLDLSDRQTARVVTLGGSVTECLLLADRDAWPRRLQDVLAARLHRPVWVGNAARSGEQTLDYVAHARVLLPALQPELVIVMPGGNDLQAAVEDRLLPLDLTDPPALARYAARLYEPVDASGLGPSYVSFWIERYLTRSTYDFAPLYGRMAARRRAAQSLDDFPALSDSLDVYRANLTQLVAALAQLRPRPRVLFLTHAALWKPEMSDRERAVLWAGYTCMDCERAEYYSPATLARALDAFNRELLSVCAASGVSCHDLASSLPRTQNTFYFAAHPRVGGPRLVAHTVGEAIIHQGLLRR
jgi:lysophospholipase L1-like esterase